MKITNNTHEGIWYGNKLLKYKNLGNLHELEGFKGLCDSPLSEDIFNLPNKFESVELSEENKSKIDSLAIKCTFTLASSSDYEYVNEKYQLIPGRILQLCFNYTDQFTDRINLLYNVVNQPSEEDIEFYLANPYLLGDEEILDSIVVKEYDKNLNILSYVQLEDLIYICSYSRYNLMGEFLGSGLISGDATVKVIRLPKKLGELQKIEYILLRYIV